MRNLNEQLAEKYFIAYAEMALWSTWDETGGSLDSNYDVNDIHEDSVRVMKKDIENFLDYCDETINDWFDKLPDHYGQVMYGNDGANQLIAPPTIFEQLVHDFWLTRNGHGAGFWDRGLGELGTALTKAAKTFGTCDLYVDNDIVYVYP